MYATGGSIVQRQQRLFLLLLLGALAFLAVSRLAGFILLFGRESLQMDFAAFYTAGEALNNGLSPYRNHVIHNPPIWDGVDIFQHSRFLYPPLAAALFQPIALLPYSVAKHIWMLLNLASIGCSLFLTMDPNLERRLEWVLVLIIFASTFHPLLTLLERGQIDGITLLLVTLAVWLQVGRSQETPRNALAAGILWALATLIKLYCVYVFLFLALRRRWITISCYILALTGLFLLPLLFNSALTLDYLQSELPRIMRFGEGGNEAMKLPAELIRTQFASLPEGYTQKDGATYRYESFSAVSNASAVRSLVSLLQRMGIDAHLSAVSMAVFLGFFVGMWIWLVRRPVPCVLEPCSEAVYWQSVLVIILLSAPLTWVMNLVWLLPVAVSALYVHSSLKNRQEACALCVCVLGLLMAWVPDHLSFSLLMPYATRLVNAKYLLSEAFVLVSLLLILETRLRHFSRCLETRG